MKYDISFQSRIVGVNNKSIFLVDEKNKEMYEIVPHKKKIRKGLMEKNDDVTEEDINSVLRL